MLVQESFDFESSSPDTMRFVPMHFGAPNPTMCLPHGCYSFALAPAPRSISSAEAGKVSDAPLNGTGFNLSNLADQFKVNFLGHWLVG